MRASEPVSAKSLCAFLVKFGVLLALLTTTLWVQSARAQESGQKKFSSAEEASQALVAASQHNDETALIAILGSDAKEIVSSGDPAEDAQNRENFVRRYQQMHRLVKEPDGTTTLYVGAENWPMPIPLVDKNGSWYFDTAAGKREILYRRVGRNEISAIHICEELVAAQREYHSAHNGRYAEKMVSGNGEQDGLYWKTAQGQPQSPIGPLVAFAGDYGSTNDQAERAPYRGYYFRILTAQGAKAPGGAKDYVSDGKMTGGFAFIAYPAEYRSSGVMTFIVGEDGAVYREDLGHDTEAIAKAMKEYNPDSTWKKDEDQQEETAQQQAH